MSFGHNVHLYVSSRLVRSLAMFAIALLMLATLLPVATASAQQKGHVGESPSATPGSPLELDPSSLDTLGDLLESSGDGDQERGSGQVVNDDFGYAINYLAPWSSYGTWEIEGYEREYFTEPAADAWVSVEAWEWASYHTVNDTLAWWTSPEMMEDWMPDGEVLHMRTVDDTSGAVAYYHPPTAEFPDPWLYVAELHVYDGYAVQVTFWASLPEFASAYGSASELIEVNATPVAGVYTANEVMDLAPAE